ncbi:MAG: hypothetical protein EOP89_00810 [Lysobacteraceae bacterium]|nr:MAG: hypothetical protein EOP89_00810 [Xanthomonadaceae bacterium]
MTNTTQNGIPAGFDAAVAFRLPTLANQAMIKDTGNVVLGGQGPVFRTPAIVDGGKVRLGGQGPAFRQASIADAGKVRLGGKGKLFR